MGIPVDPDDPSPVDPPADGKPCPLHPDFAAPARVTVVISGSTVSFACYDNLGRVVRTLNGSFDGVFRLEQVSGAPCRWRTPETSWPIGLQLVEQHISYIPEPSISTTVYRLKYLEIDLTSFNVVHWMVYDWGPEPWLEDTYWSALSPDPPEGLYTSLTALHIPRDCDGRDLIFDWTVNPPVDWLQVLAVTYGLAPLPGTLAEPLTASGSNAILRYVNETDRTNIKIKYNPESAASP